MYKDPERLKQYQKEYRRKNKEKIKQYREDNKQKLKEYLKEYNVEHRDRLKIVKDRWNKVNIEKVRESKIQSRKRNLNCRVEEYQRLRKRKPWINSYAGAKERCTSLNCKDYPRYGGRGIEFHLTQDEMGVLWLRDKAYNMERPSIDRENSDGDYVFSNCRFLELVENVKRSKT